jgi:hypothetical protein
MAAEACYFFIFLFKFQSNYLLKFYIFLVKIGKTLFPVFIDSALFLVKNRKYHWCGSQDPGVPFLFSAFLFCLSVLVTKRPWSSVSDLSLILSPRPSLMLLSASALFFFDQFFLWRHALTSRHFDWSISRFKIWDDQPATANEMTVLPFIP